MGRVVGGLLFLGVIFGLGHAVGESKGEEKVPPPVVKEVEVEVERVVTKTNTVEVLKPMPEVCILAIENANEAWANESAMMTALSGIDTHVEVLPTLSYERNIPGMSEHIEAIDLIHRELMRESAARDTALNVSRVYLDECNAEYVK